MLFRKKVTVSVLPDNKRYKEAVQINELSKERESNKNQFLLFSLAIFLGFIINLLSNYIDSWIKSFFPNLYIYFQLFILLIALLYIPLMIYIIWRYVKSEREYQARFYEISKQNPKTNYYKVGETIKGEFWELKVVKYFFKLSIKYKNSSYLPKGKFCLIDLKVRNLSSKTSLFPILYVALEDRDKIHYTYDKSTYMVSENMNIDLIPRKLYPVKISFDIPQNSKIKFLHFEKEYSTVEF